MRLLLVLLLLLVAPSVAQPAPGAVVDAWLADWRRAAAGVSDIQARETVDWTVDGPRGRLLIEADGRVRYGDGDPLRDIRLLRVDGRDVPADRARFHGRRWRRAFGPAGPEVQAPPPLPAPFLRNARPVRIEADRESGAAAWRVALDTRADRAEAWFSRTASPRLLRLRVEGARPRGGRFVRDVRYARVGGLDLPAEAETTFTVRQRRRLRDYLVTLRADATYTGHTLR